MSRPVPLALLAAALLSLLAVGHPTVLLTEAPFDIFMPLDAGLRLLQGIRPSLDYPSPVGPLYAILNGLAMWFVGVGPRAVVVADILVLGLSLGLLLVVLRGTSGAARLTVPVIVAGCLLLPVDLDTVPPDYRYVANYNNWSWAFMAVVAVWALRDGASRRLDAVAVGLAASCIFFIKLSMFFFVIPVMALGLLGGRRAADYRLPVLILAGAVAVDAWCGHLLPYLRDNIAVARATDSIRPEKILWQIFALYNAPATVMLILALYRQRWRGTAVKALVGAWLLFNLAALQNHDKLIPVIALPLLLTAPGLPRIAQSWARFPAVIHAVLLFLAVGIGYAVQPVVAQAVRAAPLGQSGTLGADILLSSMLDTGDWHAPAWGDGLPHTDAMVHAEFQSLEELLGGRHGSALALEFSNAALAAWPAITPAAHAPLWYDINRSFSQRSFTDPASAFSGLDFVLVPRRHRTDNTRILVGLYQPWLDRCATVTAENELWRLYAPKSNAPCR
jgi:hypothetical protein